MIQMIYYKINKNYKHNNLKNWTHKITKSHICKVVMDPR